MKGLAEEKLDLKLHKESFVDTRTRHENFALRVVTSDPVTEDGSHNQRERASSVLACFAVEATFHLCHVAA